MSSTGKVFRASSRKVFSFARGAPALMAFSVPIRCPRPAAALDVVADRGLAIVALRQVGAIERQRRAQRLAAAYKRAAAVVGHVQPLARASTGLGLGTCQARNLG